VQFNVICSGQIATRMMADESLQAATALRISAGRMGQPEEVAEAPAWLLPPRL
jgi:NAD(P)-dependent dehydrogenase (short-subunit alcohol dehydrogenase family)